MSDDGRVTGKCLCGAIELTASRVSSKVGACHCGTCRKWGGGPWLAVDCCTEVSLEGEERLSVFDSSPWAERGFCQVCGTHLFYRLKQNGQYIVSAGLLGDLDRFELDHQIFIDSKPPFYDFANETTTMTGAEVFAKFAPPPS